MSLCKDFETAEVCATAADGTRTTYVAHYEYGLGVRDETTGIAPTVLVATRYANADGSPVDLDASTVTAGACPVYQPDIEFERLCDVLPDGNFTEFLCRTITSFDAAGAVIDPAQITYFELDKVTPYTPVGTVGPCPDCPPAVAQGVLTSWGA